MRILDLFCSEGGAAAGYASAGFEVLGYDLDEQPLYPYEFHQGDALALDPAWIAANFDAVHASPPCQGYSTITPAEARDTWPRLVEPTRSLLDATGLPYVIENVAGARRELIDPMMLCGSSFGLRVRRHRFFESNVWLMGMPCDHAAQGAPIGVYGSHGDLGRAYARPGGTSRGLRAADVAEARALMGMPWASWHGCVEAIPPAYTEFIGGQLAALIRYTSRVA